jgi:type VI secretion system protein ImpG
MSTTLYPYYERELIAIRQLAQEFARQYPAAAGRLMLEANRSTDPHVERLIEAFALLAGRVHHKLDDELPEFTDGLLNILYPHFLAPVPSCLVVQFVADPARTPLLDGFTIPRHTEVITPPVNDLRCRYRTTYPVNLWPVVITDARLQGPPWQGLRLPSGFRMPDGTTAVLRLQLECQAGAKFADLSLDSLRFHLLGENQIVAELYELLLNHASQVSFVPADKPDAPRLDRSPSNTLAVVGYEPDEGLFPYPAQSFPGYRLLTEFFAFPAKFWFVDLLGLGSACRAGFGKRLDVLICLKRTSTNLEKAVEAATFRLGCAPAVNLFEQTAEPIPVTQARYEYRVVPQADQPNGMEVYSVDGVTGVEGDGAEPVRYRPFFDITHPGGRAREASWYASRRPATKQKDIGTEKDTDHGTEVFLNLVNRDWDPLMPATSTLVVRTTCTNRELASALQRAGDQLALELKLAAPVSEVRCVRTPTLPLRPPRHRRGAYWRLLSHLSLNHLSLTDPEEGRLALQEILRLYDFSDADSGHQRAEVLALLVEGLIGVSSRRVVGRVGEAAAAGFCRGVEVTIELDEEKYVGTGAFLFASVLERFLALYTTVNSFTQLVAVAKQGGRVIKRWPPRTGDKPLL